MNFTGTKHSFKQFFTEEGPMKMGRKRNKKVVFGFSETVRAAVCVMIAACSFSAMSYTVTARDSVADGLVFTMSNNAKMKVQICTDKIIRIIYTLQTTFPAATNYIVVKGTWNAVNWTGSETAAAYSLITSSLKIDVSKTTGAVTFNTAAGTQILQETTGKTLTQKTVGTLRAYEGTIPFNGTADEGLYGFGQFQNGQLNQRGLTLSLTQQNQSDCSPFFISTRGFGVLWVNYSMMSVTPPLTLWSNWATNDALDYYFMYGPAFDTLIAGYRTITGPAVMWPKWAYGFWQCRNAYGSQSELLSIVTQYRAKNYPFDNIVQDWQYYPSGRSGCQCFDPTRYSDPKAMIKRMHDSLHCHFTISVWPSYATGSGANYNYMSSHGYLINNNDYLGTVYDAFSDSAAFYYWKFINDSLVSKDVDAFWPDATEPEYYSGWITATTSAGPAVKVQNIFPLLHSRTLYNGYRAAFQGNKRVCNLTRSYYAGSQRLGAAYWTGDINTDFATYTRQVPALLNVSMSGLPLSCTDVGGFNGAVTANVMTRWFEWGAFCPVFRVHGTRACNEVWCWGTTTEQYLAKYLKLRYRLFPYVYSLAWKGTSEGYTMMRALPFDFANDATVRDITSQFMFGPAFMICPITSSETATSRPVYLPTGTWYDFWTGAPSTGAAGRTVTAATPMDIIPVYIRAGSIVPMGPDILYADTMADPIELRVYPGANGSFNFYEDEGDNYSYETGVYATIPISWDEASQNLTIGQRQGTFPGIKVNRTINVVFVSLNHGIGGTVSTVIDKSLSYNGAAIVLNKTTGQIVSVGSPSAPSAMRSSFKDRIQGRNYFIATTGENMWRITLTNIAGKVIARKNVRGGASCLIADRLPSGVYFAQVMYGNVLVKRKTLIIHN
jgi:alpha-D-xyloside xylohydrolase